MSDQNEISATEDQSKVDRRAFLKKAGLAVGAAAALYVVPSVTTVKADPAYTALTGVTSTPTPTPTPCPDMDASFVEWITDDQDLYVRFSVTGCALIAVSDDSGNVIFATQSQDESATNLLGSFADVGFEGTVVFTNCCDPTDTKTIYLDYQAP